MPSMVALIALAGAGKRSSMRRVIACLIAAVVAATVTACGPDEQKDWSKYSLPVERGQQPIH